MHFGSNEDINDAEPYKFIFLPLFSLLLIKKIERSFCYIKHPSDSMLQMSQKAKKLLNANILVLASSHDKVTLLALEMV